VVVAGAGGDAGQQAVHQRRKRVPVARVEDGQRVAQHPVAGVERPAAGPAAGGREPQLDRAAVAGRRAPLDQAGRNQAVDRTHRAGVADPQHRRQVLHPQAGGVADGDEGVRGDAGETGGGLDSVAHAVVEAGDEGAQPVERIGHGEII
jgi:hypothetical protein